jgi:hypothetical protein
MCEQSTIQNIKNQNPRAKKTRKKLVTQWINTPLMLLNSPIKKYYERAYHCSSRLYQQGSKIHSRYCNSRTCISCNGIRTAAYIKHYGNELLSLTEPYFLTLTAPTVQCYDSDTLRHFIDGREFVWRKIYENARVGQKGIVKLKGMRAMEITARPDDYYHIHFHFIIDGFQNAVWVKSQWLKHYPSANEKAQAILPITSKGGLLEVFKYGTKFIEKIDKIGKNGKVEGYEKVPAERTDIIIQALNKKRLISTFGGVRKMKDDDVNEMEVESQIDLDVAYDIWEWYNDLEDWFSQGTGEKFSDFVPTKKFRKVFEEL